MNKRTFLILIVTSLVAAIIGIVLICISSTPYQNLSYWLEDPYSWDAYLYAKQNIGKYTAMYFSGFALVIAGSICTIVAIIKKIIAKKEKVIPTDITTNLD